MVFHIYSLGVYGWNSTFIYQKLFFKFFKRWGVWGTEKFTPILKIQTFYSCWKRANVSVETFHVQTLNSESRWERVRFIVLHFFLNDLSVFIFWKLWQNFSFFRTWCFVQSKCIHSQYFTQPDVHLPFLHICCVSGHNEVSERRRLQDLSLSHSFWLSHLTAGLSAPTHTLSLGKCHSPHLPPPPPHSCWLPARSPRLTHLWMPIAPSNGGDNSHTPVSVVFSFVPTYMLSPLNTLKPTAPSFTRSFEVALFVLLFLNKPKKKHF